MQIKYDTFELRLIQFNKIRYRLRLIVRHYYYNTNMCNTIDLIEQVIPDFWLSRLFC